jgi:hypothetical protein
MMTWGECGSERLNSTLKYYRNIASGPTAQKTSFPTLLLLLLVYLLRSNISLV